MYGQLKLIQTYNPIIVNITRNRSDTLKSANNYVSEERYNSCIDQMVNYAGYITLNVRYEEILSNPNAVQNYFSEFLALDILHNWSDFPDWFDSSDEPSTGNWKDPGYKLRRIGSPKSDNTAVGAVGPDRAIDEKRF